MGKNTIHTKKCADCKETLSVDKFPKRNRGYENDYYSYCKKCEKDRKKEWYEKNMEYVLQKAKDYLLIPENREYNRKKCRGYYENNKEKHREYSKKYRENNREYVNELERKYYWANPNRRNKKRPPNYHSEQWKKRSEKYPHVMAWRSLLKRTIAAMNYSKSSSTIEMLGYSPDEFKKHIESLFENGMSWENHGEWHIHHVMPVSGFDKKTPASIVNGLSNLKPLWAKDNLSLGNKIAA